MTWPEAASQRLIMLGLTGVLAYARRHTKVRAAPKVAAEAAPPAPLLLRVLRLPEVLQLRGVLGGALLRRGGREVRLPPQLPELPRLRSAKGELRVQAGVVRLHGGRVVAVQLRELARIPSVARQRPRLPISR